MISKEKLRNPIIYNFLGFIANFLMLFTLQRFTLLLYNKANFADVPLPIILQAFFYGLRFDLSVTLYPLSILFLINYLIYFLNYEKILKYFNAVCLSIVFLVFTFLCLVEINFYNYFHVRLNTYAFNTLDNPKFVLKMIWEMYNVPLYLTIIIVCSALAYWGFLKIQKMVYKIKYKQNFIYKFVYFVIFSALIFLGIRGTVEIKTPLRWGHAYFCTYNSANQLTLNGIFNLGSEVLFGAKSEYADLHSMLNIGDRDKSIEIVKRMIQDSTGKFIDFPLRRYDYHEDANTKKYNVVIILLESFSSYFLDYYQNQGYDLNFNKIKNDGIYFENYYSNGFHTYMGLFSSIYGMPNVYGKSIMQRHEGQQEFCGLTNILKQKGYTSYFGVSHTPNFDNMGGFLKGNGLDGIISQFDLPQSEVISSLGVADHKLFAKMNEKFRSTKQPFLGIILSTNNHGPWVLPKVPGKKFHNTFDYTDWALKTFLDSAAKEEYFKNTIFVITGDHGAGNEIIYDINLQHVHIPLLIYNPNIIQPKLVHNIASDIDLGQILLGLLKFNYETTNFGRNVLEFPNEPTGFAVVQENKTIGIIKDDWYLIDRMEGNSSLYNYKSENKKADYVDDNPGLVKDMKSLVRNYYYQSNDLIFKRKVAYNKK